MKDDIALVSSLQALAAVQEAAVQATQATLHQLTSGARPEGSVSPGLSKSRLSLAAEQSLSHDFQRCGICCWSA